MNLGALLGGLLGLALVLLAGALEWHGHHRGYADGMAAATRAAQAKVDAAQAEAAQARAERDAAQQGLRDVQQALAAEEERLQHQQDVAQAALATNATLVDEAKKLARQRQRNTVQVGHDDPQCVDLARLGVCPSVSRRLWPADGSASEGH